MYISCPRAVIAGLIALGLTVPVSFAFAQEDASVEGSAEVNVDVFIKQKPPLRALREKHEEAKDAWKEGKQNLREDRRALIDKTLDVNASIRTDRREFRKGVSEDWRAMHGDVRTAFKAATTTASKRAILKDAREDRHEFRLRVKADAEAMRDDFRERRGELRDERRELAGDHLRNIMHRLVNALERFDQILARIDSRIEKLAVEGIDTSAAVSASASASASIDAASTAVASAQAEIDAAASSETPRDRVDEIRAAVRAAIDAVKAAHRALKDALQALKNLPRLEADVSVSTETSVEVETE